MVVIDDTRDMRDAVFFEGPEVRQRLRVPCKTCW
jgi:hypothetical protein